MDNTVNLYGGGLSVSSDQGCDSGGRSSEPSVPDRRAGISPEYHRSSKRAGGRGRPGKGLAGKLRSDPLLSIQDGSRPAVDSSPLEPGQKLGVRLRATEQPEISPLYIIQTWVARCAEVRVVSRESPQLTRSRYRRITHICAIVPAEFASSSISLQSCHM